MSNTTKKYIYVGLAVVLLAAVLWFVYSKTNFFGNQANNVSTTPSESTATSTANAPAKSSSKTIAPLSATQRYLDAIRIYKNVGYYFQFVSCHGSPGSLTLKAGKKFMLDNRDNVTHKIAVQGGQTFQVGAYNFAIATAPSTIGTHYITCDGGGAASIIVQN